jgi:hypothetical protein
VTRSTHVYAAKKCSLCGWCSWSVSGDQKL